MAEAPAAAPANTKDTLLENIKALIKNTFDEEEPRGNNTASLAVHAAMAEAMADVIQDHTITQNCQIDTEFVEKCPVPLTVRGTQALVSFAPLAFKLFCAARQNAVLRRSPFPSP